jgi:hypothetical protein
MRYSKTQLESIVLGQLENLFAQADQILLLRKLNLLLERKIKTIEESTERTKRKLYPKLNRKKKFKLK